MTEAQPVASSAEPQTFCVNHPTIATGLRCNRCGSYICSRCALRTPVGYRCKSCIKTQQAVFYTAQPSDYVIAAVIALPLTFITQLIATAFGGMLGFLVIFAGPVVGSLIAELVWRATGKRRGQYTWLVVAGCMALSGLPILVGALFLMSVYWALWPAIFLVLAVGAAVARFRYTK